MRAVASLLLLLLLASAAPVAAIELALPIDCSIGEDCAVQHYVDRDPGADGLDYMCGHQTYDGHDGVDIRLLDLRQMAGGVAVLAAADGVVVATRDGMADVNVADTGVEAVRDVECGNGVLVEHADGWQSQYCHMKNGSIRVRKGDAVRVGMPLGEVGLSGLTEFPHVHFSVRHGDTEIDPFALDAVDTPSACAFAGDGATSIWTPEAEAALAYRPAFILNAGFTEGAVEMNEVESGELADVKVTAQSPALVFYGRAIGLEKGDIQRVVIEAPDGTLFADNEIEPLDRPKAQYMAFTGKKLRGDAWPVGTWRGRYAVIRDGREIARREIRLEIGEP